MSKTKLRSLSRTLLDREEQDMTDVLMKILDQFEVRLQAGELSKAKALLDVFIERLEIGIKEGKFSPFGGNILMLEANKTKLLIDSKEKDEGLNR